MTDEASFMARALELAARGLNTTDPNPRVGCVLVRGERIVGEGWHMRAGEAHAEVLALRAAGGEARGAAAYVTLEPCCHSGRTPPCAEALIAAGVTRVVCASLDPNPKVAGGGLERLEAAGIATLVGILGDPARALNVGFFSRFERRRPFIRLKLAMSVDARTAPAGGGSAWITGHAARADVQTLRARSSAVLTGAGTVRADDPQLNVRLEYAPWVRQPLRVVLDPNLNCDPRARVFRDDQALIFAATDAQPQPESTIRTERVPRSPTGLDLQAVVARLAALEVNELLVECGPRLAAGFLAAELVDELILYVAPHFLGADAAPLAAFSGLHDPARMPRFEFKEQCRVGRDLRLVLTPQRG